MTTSIHRRDEVLEAFKAKITVIQEGGGDLFKNVYENTNFADATDLPFVVVQDESERVTDDDICHTFAELNVNVIVVYEFDPSNTPPTDPASTTAYKRGLSLLRRIQVSLAADQQLGGLVAGAVKYTGGGSVNPIGEAPTPFTHSFRADYTVPYAFKTTDPLTV